MKFSFEQAVMRAKAQAGIRTDLDLCVRSGISQTSMSNLVKGVTKSPKLVTCERIAAACDIRTSDFISMGEIL